MAEREPNRTQSANLPSATGAGSESHCVGRRAELDRLLALHQRAQRAGSGEVALLTGAPGIGKSRLVAELVTRLRADGHAVLEGTCRDDGVAYQPFVEIAQSALAHLVDAGASGERLARAAELASALRGTAPRRAAVVTPAATRKLQLVRDLPDGRLAFFDRVRHLLVDAGAAIVVHDLHLADAATASLFAYLARTLAAGPSVSRRDTAFASLLLATSQDGPAPTFDEVGATVITLAGLDLEGVRAFLASPQIAERFLRATDGVPGRLEALAAGAFRGLAGAESHVALALSALTPPAARLLRSLAIHGRPAGAALLEKLSAALDGEADLAAHELRDCPLLARSVSGGELRLGFAVAADRAAVVRALAPDEAVALHRVVGEVLARDLESGDATDPAACAEHLLRGHAGELAVDVSLAAGEGLERAYAYERAIALYLAAREVTGRPEIATLLDERLADLHQLTGDYARALEVVHRLAERRPGDAATAGRLGHLQLLRGDFAVARVALERARDLAAAAGDVPLRAQIAADLAEAHFCDGAHDEALAAGGATLAGAGSDPLAARGRISARNTLGKVCLERGEYARAAQLFGDNQFEAASAGLAFEISRALINLGIAALRQGDSQAAEAHYQAGLNAACANGDQRHRAFCLQNLGVLAQWRRDYGATLAHYQDAVQAFKRLGHRPWLAWVAIDLGDLYLGLGDATRAQAMVDLATRLSSEVPTAAIILDNLRGRLLLEAGELSGAAALFAGALDAAVRVGNRDELSLTLLNLARVELLAGDTIASLRRLSEVPAPRSSRTEAARLAARGEAHLALRDFTAARNNLDAAAAAYAGLGDDEGRLRALLLRAAVAEAEGDTRAARQAQRTALDLDASLRRRVPADFAASYGQEPLRLALRAPVAAPVAAPAPRPARPATPPAGFSKLVGQSAALVHVLEMVERVAPHDTLVLIRGESGTGKELVAEAIHERSPRRGRPFVKVNCGALVDTLLLSELFGHERGAFTGAQSRRKGRFELADGGTLFLDEIGDISPQTQVALLRVLQTHEFERVGGSQPVRVDVRIVCATNRDLEAMVSSGRFREDLYYRLKGVEIGLPALRERAADVPHLVRHFLARIADERKTFAKQICPPALEALARHPWPGNIRELENVIRSVTLFTDGETITAEDLHEYLGTPAPTQPAPTPAPAPTPGNFAPYDTITSGVPLKELKRQIELECITRALAEANGNITHAAERLGMKRPRLSQLLKEHNLGPPRATGVAPKETP